MATLALLGSGLVWAQAATDVDCSECVDASDIAAGSIKNNKIQQFAVQSDKIAKQAVTSPKIAPEAVTTGKIKDGAVTPEKMAPTDADFNTRYGDLALVNNAAGEGIANTAVGIGALQFNTTGDLNTATGVDALGDNTTGRYNTATGVNALWHNLSGEFNTANGLNALRENTIGSGNTAVGAGSLIDNVDGVNNTACGRRALAANTSGSDNVAVGAFALTLNSTALNNTAVGGLALYQNSTGGSNTAIGNSVLASNTTGENNTALGQSALSTNTIGKDNVAIGFNAGLNTTGDRNIMISNAGVSDESNTIRIGNANHTRVFVHGIEGRTTGIADAVTVVIDSNGQLGTIDSSARYKEEIADMADASDRLMQLRPVSFIYKQPYRDGQKPIQYGLIAEEVAEVFPELVVYDEDNQPQTIKYRLLSSLLLNELKKQNASLEAQAQQLILLEAQVEELIKRVGQVGHVD
jgi:hypothetical protein